MFQHDQVMSVSATTKTNGGTQATQTFWAFGETQATTGTSVTRLKFMGREDEGNGLYQFRARLYDPRLGIFDSEDPIKFAGGINLYAFVGNDPIDANDPSGLAPVDAIGRAIQYIGERLPRNWKLAGDVHPKTGIPFTEAGFPDFSGVSIKSVTVTQSGNRAADEAAANAAAGLSKTPAGYTWHHVEDGATMQLVPTDVHAATEHSGGVSVVKAGVGAGAAGAAGSAQASDGSSWGLSWQDVKNAAGAVKDFAIDVATDPLTYLPRLNVPALLMTPTSLGGCNSRGVCSDMVQWPKAPSNPNASFNDLSSSADIYSGAAGGFLIYPNKPNNNSIATVYRK